jgi:CRISPR/Cas system-associated protein Cas10 (large subunit of type III CRISPR-Cas system)
MEEQTIIEELIELDTRATDINARRKKQLAELKGRYQEEEKEMLRDYASQIEDETKKTTKKILKEAQQEVDQLKLNTREVLENMEREFEKSLKNMTDEILKRIFDIHRESHG